MAKKILILDDPLVIQSTARGLKDDLNISTKGVTDPQKALELLVTNQYCAFIIDTYMANTFNEAGNWYLPPNQRPSYNLLVEAHKNNIPTIVRTTTLTSTEREVYAPRVIGFLIKPACSFELSLLLYQYGVSNYSSKEEELRQRDMLHNLQPKLRNSRWEF